MTQGQYPEAIQKMIDEFAMITDNRKRMLRLVQLGRAMDPLDNSLKTPEHLVPGCIAKVYIYGEQGEDSKMCYYGDADAVMLKGLVAVLINGMNQLTPQEVLDTPPDFIKRLGIKQSLVPSRANGFYNIFKRIQDEAAKHIAS